MTGSDGIDSPLRPATVADTSDLSRSLYAEYLRMLVALHAVVGALFVLLHQGPGQEAGLIAVSAVWVVLRAMGGLRWSWMFPGITALLLGCLAVMVPGQTSGGMSALQAGQLAAYVSLLLLALIGLLDVVQAASRLGTGLQTLAVRERIFLVMKRHGLRLLLWGSVGFVLAYSTIVPLVQEWLYLRAQSAGELSGALDRLTLTQNVLFRFCESMTAVWFFVVGCCVGSFLNVVIYRVPLSISVLAKASHCPHCGVEISKQDNLPLIGWLKIEGCCRSCGTAVSARYPLVELAIGLLFLLLYFVELISGGINLPGRPPNMFAGVLWILFYTKWDLVSLYLFHCFVLCALFSWTMIQRDGNRLPTRASAATITIVVVLVLIWPHLLPFTVSTEVMRPVAGFAWSRLGTTLLHLLTGAAAGLVVGAVVRRICGIPQHLTWWLLVGLTYGWQAVPVIGVLAVLAKLMLTVATMLGARVPAAEAKTTVTGESPAGSTQTSRPPDSPAVPGSASSIVGETGPAAFGSDSSVSRSGWWLLPMMVLVHHCLWRPLAALAGDLL